MNAPKLVIRIPDGRTVFTKVTLNGEDVMATRVSFDTGDAMDGWVKARLEFYADIDVEMAGGTIELVPRKRSAVAFDSGDMSAEPPPDLGAVVAAAVEAI